MEPLTDREVFDKMLERRGVLNYIVKSGDLFIVKFVRKDPYTIAIVERSDMTHLYTYYGISKRNPVDDDNAMKGDMLALSRAADDCAEKIRAEICVPSYASDEGDERVPDEVIEALNESDREHSSCEGVAIGIALSRGMEMSCGCFASEGAAEDPISWRTLARDGGWLLLMSFSRRM